jgi:hypothetical protein
MEIASGTSKPPADICGSVTIILLVYIGYPRNQEFSARLCSNKSKLSVIL